MKYEITGKNGFVPTQAIKDYVVKKLKKVEDFFSNEAINEARVVLKVYKNYQKVEVTIPAGSFVLRSEVSDPDMYAAIDKSVDKLLAQVKKNKSKLQAKLEKEGIKQVYANENVDVKSLEKEILANQLVKNKKIELTPMTSDEAILAMEVSGHDFFVYRDKGTKRINVVYLREDGNYAVIETN